MKRQYISPLTQVVDLDSEHLMSFTTSLNEGSIDAGDSFTKKKDKGLPPWMTCDDEEEY